MNALFSHLELNRLMALINKESFARGSKAWVTPVAAIQVLHQLAVTGYDYGYIAVLIGGQEFMIKRVERDDEMIANLIEIERRFWTEHVEKGVPPAFDGSEDATEALKRLYPATNGKSIDLPPEAAVLVQEYNDAAQAEKAAKARKQAAQNHLCGLLGEHESGWIGNRLVIWKTVERAGYTVKPTTYRQFGIKEVS